MVEHQLVCRTKGNDVLYRYNVFRLYKGGNNSWSQAIFAQISNVTALVCLSDTFHQTRLVHVFDTDQCHKTDFWRYGTVQYKNL